jgi:phasin family protein
VARTVETVQAGLGSATEVAQRSAEQFIRFFEASGQQTQTIAERSSQALETMADATNVIGRGVQELARECMTLSQERLQRNVEGLTALSQCRSLQEFVGVQSELVRDNLQRTVENSRRVAEVSVRVAEEAARAISSRRAA